ncbi:MAG TPA: ATP-grasp domain-containing protein [Thermoleophilia bacterium]|nr:ATP-grasp domain-containing protein [Thermoleophilia bacterium]
MSTRAMAESAARAGARVVAVDFFGDRDQTRAAKSRAVRRDLGLPATAAGLARAALDVGVDAVVYGANLENHPDLVARLARKRRVLGNEAAAVRAVRDWRVLRRFCAEESVACPMTLFAGEEPSSCERERRWLRKRLRSGGGHGVRRWDGRPLDGAHLLQEEVQGRAASASFVADGHAARVFALSEQLTGDRALGARGRVWCGNILPLVAPSRASVEVRLRAEVERLATLLTRRFGLRGVNGIDLVVHETSDGGLVPYLVEVNPRFTASMELAELAYGVSVFSLHLEGCAGRLPAARPAEEGGMGGAAQGSAGGAAQCHPAGVLGKAVVYARRPVVTPDTGPWLEEMLDRAWLRGAVPAVRDIPASGERIAAGHPVCTVFAAAADREACLADLREAATIIEKSLHDGERQREVRRGRALHVDQRTHA